MIAGRLTLSLGKERQATSGWDLKLDPRNYDALAR